MPIPHADEAIIPADKLTAYLLNPLHPVGGPKARLLLRLGYQNEVPERLATDLLAIIRESDDFVSAPEPGAVRFVVRGSIRTPSGRMVDLQTVWIVDDETNVPRLVTAYPARSFRDAT